MEENNDTFLFQNDSGLDQQIDNVTLPVKFPLSYQISASLLIGALILCSIFGNACVVAAIALERSLQNVANYLIGSLAVTDLMVSVLVLPMAALYQVLDKWTLGQVTCDIFISLDILCCTSSILHLCAIALDRYWGDHRPNRLHAEKDFKTRRSFNHRYLVCRLFHLNSTHVDPEISTQE